MLEQAERRRVADVLRDAERDRVAVDPVIETFPGIDVVDAYAVQLLQVGDKLAAGATVRGHKVGLSARAMQQMMGVSEPDYGHLLDSMFLFEGQGVSAAQFLRPRIEPEVAFVLDAPLRGPGVSAADVARATAYVLPALELIDSRVRDWRISIVDTIADNASSARVVLGGRPVRLDDVDVRLLGCVLRRNGEIMETGAAGAVLGNPVTAVAWLANKLAEFGGGLEAGHVVLPGSCTRAVDARPGDVFRADFDVLGHVSVVFTA